MRIVVRIFVSMILLIILAGCVFGCVAMLEESHQGMGRLPWLALFTGVGVFCLLALCFYKRLVCPGCGHLVDPRRRCGRCGSPLPLVARIFAVGLMLVWTGMLFLAMTPDGGSHPPSPASAYKGGYASGFEFGARTGLEGEEDALSVQAWERAADAARRFRGTLHEGLRDGFSHGRIAALASKEPHELPKWVNANHPAVQAEWFRLAEEMKAIGSQLERLDGLLARTATLQARLEVLAKERPSDDRALLDADCDKLSKLAAVLREYYDGLAEDKARAKTK